MDFIDEFLRDLDNSNEKPKARVYTLGKANDIPKGSSKYGKVLVNKVTEVDFTTTYQEEMERRDPGFMPKTTTCPEEMNRRKSRCRKVIDGDTMRLCGVDPKVVESKRIDCNTVAKTIFNVVIEYAPHEDRMSPNGNNLDRTSWRGRPVEPGQVIPFNTKVDGVYKIEWNGRTYVNPYPKYFVEVYVPGMTDRKWDNAFKNAGLVGLLIKGTDEGFDDSVADSVDEGVVGDAIKSVGKKAAPYIAAGAMALGGVNAAHASNTQANTDNGVAVTQTVSGTQDTNGGAGTYHGVEDTSIMNVMGVSYVAYEGLIYKMEDVDKVMRDNYIKYATRCKDQNRKRMDFQRWAEIIFDKYVKEVTPVGVVGLSQMK